MKKTLLTLTLAVLSVAAFGQGRVALQLGAPVLFSTDSTKLLAADSSLAGSAIPNDPAKSSSTFWLALYGSSTAAGTVQDGTLTYLTSIQINLGTGAPDGYTLTKSLSTSLLTGGVSSWFQFAAYSGTSTTTYATATVYRGYGDVFTMTPTSGSTAYANTLTSSTSTYDQKSFSVSLVPEPSSFALAGLGAAAMLIFRRRK
jgi:hypothetical protein